MTAGTFTIQALATASGVSARTLRDWINHELLPKPVGRSRAARYTTQHLLRARAVQHLRNSGAGLREIRNRLAALNEQELQALIPPSRSKTADGAPGSPPEPTYPSAMWEVVQLMDGMVLMLNPDRGPVLRRIAQDIYCHYALPLQAPATRGGKGEAAS